MHPPVPDRVIVARKLIEGMRLDLWDTFEREPLRAALAALGGRVMPTPGPQPTDLPGAMEEVMKGVRHAFRPDFVEDRPESWVLAAVYWLLHDFAQESLLADAANDT